MKDYKYLFFDLDGTLTDPSEGITKCVKYALDYYGIPCESPDSLLKFIGPPMTESFRDFYGFDERKAVEATNKYRERYNTIGLFENRPLEGAEQALRELKSSGRILAVATSKPEPTSVQILDKFGMSKYFETIAGSGLDGSFNTKAAVIEKAIARLGIEDRSQIVMIGDRMHDIIGAKKCGIDSIGLYVGFAEPGELETAGADYIFHSFEELTREFGC